jgi:hypothetical protein
LGALPFNIYVRCKLLEMIVIRPFNAYDRTHSYLLPSLLAYYF